MEDQRRYIVQAAQNLRKRGRYPEALEQFREAQTHQNDLSISTEIAGMLLEQGLVNSSLEEVNSGREQCYKSENDPVRQAISDLLLGICTTSSTVQYTPFLTRGREVYSLFLQENDVAKYDKPLTMLLLSYCNLLNLADIGGVEIAAYPAPTLQHLEDLFVHLVRGKRFSEAARIATNYRSMAPAAPAMKLILDVAKQKDLPPLVKAECFLELAEHEHDSGNTVAALKILSKAKSLYEEEKHVTGPSRTAVQMCSYQLPGNPDERRILREKLTKLKQKLKTFQDYGGIREALRVLFEISALDRDEDLLMSINEEMYHISKVRGFTVDWIFQKSYMARRFHPTGPSAAPMIESLEMMYNEMKDMEAPKLRAGLVGSLVSYYETLGDTERVKLWMSRVPQETSSVPRYSHFLHDMDPFFRDLKNASSAPEDPQEEINQLRRELEQTVKDVDPATTPPQYIYLGIMKIIQISQFYLSQQPFPDRTVQRIQFLVETCLSYAPRLMSIVPKSQKTEWEGQIQQVLGRLEFILACTGPPDPEGVSRSIKYTKKAAQLYKKAKSYFNCGTVLNILASAYQMKWGLDELSPSSAAYGDAFESYEEAYHMISKQRNITSMRLSRSQQLQLLLLGCQRNVEYRRYRSFWKYLGVGYLANTRPVHALAKHIRLPQFITARSWMFLRSPYEEAIEVLLDAEKLVDEERQSLSALRTQQALLAKRFIRKDPSIETIFRNGTSLLALGDDAAGLWTWVQRCKARSVSDLLGVGINIPADLLSVINGDPVTKNLFEEEKALETELAGLATSERVRLIQKLQAHRRQMTQHECLQELLDLRNGKPATWERLSQLKNVSIESERRTWFIDWGTIGPDQTFFVTMVSDEQEFYHAYVLDATVSSAKKWVETHMRGEMPLNDETSLQGLAELSAYFSPILEHTTEGDLLVLCPTNILHRVPLHAAIISGDPDGGPRRYIPLIKRNPIVYTSSMTVFEQNCLMAAQRQQQRDNKVPNHGVVLGVFEDPTEVGWEYEKESIYNTCNELGTSMGWTAMTGHIVNRVAFEEACQSDILHFYGHCECESENMLDQGIVLRTPTSVPEVHSGADVRRTSPAEIAQELSSERDLFTAGDIFKCTVSSSLITLIACGSAKQEIQTGDEPLGIVTALLYARASSVVGTLWPIDSGPGGEFSRLFYKAFAVNDAESGTSVIDLAVSLQKAVESIRWGADTDTPYHWAPFVLHGNWHLTYQH